MESEWIRKRFERLREKESAAKQRQQWDANAAAAYNSMFDALKARVAADVAAYNRLFAERSECIARFDGAVDGFCVEIGPRAVRVRRPRGTTVIDIEYVSADRENVISAGNYDHFEVAADERGQVRYRHKKEFLEDTIAASERLLDRILCG